MKAALLSILTLALLLAAGVVIHCRQNATRVQDGSATAFARMYAKNVASFYEANNRFPNTTAELADAVFGEWISNHTFVLVDETQKMFSIIATTAPNHVVKLQFQLSGTGLIETATDPPGK